jgi:hypothetical protein
MAGTSILLGTAETERYEDAKEKSLEHKTRRDKSLAVYKLC